MNFLSDPNTILGVIKSLALLAVILQQFLKAIGKWWGQTPGTPKTEVFTKAGKMLHIVQRILGAVVGDTATVERSRDSQH